MCTKTLFVSLHMTLTLQSPLTGSKTWRMGLYWPNWWADLLFVSTLWLSLLSITSWPFTFPPDPTDRSGCAMDCAIASVCRCVGVDMCDGLGYPPLSHLVARRRSSSHMGLGYWRHASTHLHLCIANGSPQGSHLYLPSNKASAPVHACPTQISYKSSSHRIPVLTFG